MFDIKYNVSILPNLPGVYIMKDKNSQVLYVGKAKNLKKRVSQYFQQYKNKSEKTKNLVKHIVEFEYIVTQNEIEALILENNLIKKYKPRYNILLKDDKTYPFIKITVKEDFPRILSTKHYVKDGSVYFGPFTASGAVNEIITGLINVFSIRRCKMVIKEGQIACKPCMYYQIKKCNAPCYDLISKSKYNENINHVIDILSGKNKNMFMKTLEDEMIKYSNNLEYEKALIIRDKIKSINHIFEKQRIFLGNNESEDYINIYKDSEHACIQVFFLREGKIIGRDHFIFENIYDDNEEELVAQFIKEFYLGTAQIPNHIYTIKFSDMENIEQWIRLQTNTKVIFKTPIKGDEKQLLDLVGLNARIMFKRFRSRQKVEVDDTEETLFTLGNILNIDSPLDRIESYDISNINGTDSVGSMVVFEKGLPQNSQYRRFKIKNVQGPNDYESIKEVVKRRFDHGLKEINEQDQKGKFSIFPNLILIDGGRGHVNIIENLLNEMNIYIPVCGMVKDNKHKTRGLIYKNQELNLDINSDIMKLIAIIQDETHRYAISYHKMLRSKKLSSSILDEIPNIGEKRKKDLLIHFKNIEAIKVASIDELLQVSSMDKRACYSLIDFFKNRN